jgi:hypothetical protein
VPNPIELPIIGENTSVQASNGTTFFLTHDLDFRQKNGNGKYLANILPETNDAGEIIGFIMWLPGLCVSGQVTTETFEIGNTYIPFRTITLGNSHVTSILRVYDSDGNEYHEVESLTQDTVFRKNKLSDGKSSIDIIPAPYRFITSVDVTTRSTTMQFGSGNSEDAGTLNDPSQLALPLYGKKAFSQFSLDPNDLMTNNSLGVSPTNTVITVEYRYGGGASHNVEPNSINQLNTIRWRFPPGIPYDAATKIKNSASVENLGAASGGATAPTLTELKQYITAAKTMQNRVVTKEDLLARIYTMPTDFGMVYRANVLPNPANALASILYVVSRDSEGNLTTCSDALKRNLSTYLNEFRLIGDAMDILDGRIINFRINIVVKLTPAVNSYDVVNKIINNVSALFPIDEVALGKPINTTVISNTVGNVTGVVSIDSITVNNINVDTDIYEYSHERKNMDLSKEAGVYYAEPYEIFELRYPQADIIVTVV